MILGSLACLAAALHGLGIRESKLTLAIFRRVPGALLELLGLGALRETKEKQLSSSATRLIAPFRWAMAAFAVAFFGAIALIGLFLTILSDFG
jgi:hypothetical protein